MSICLPVCTNYCNCCCLQGVIYVCCLEIDLQSTTMLNDLWIAGNLALFSLMVRVVTPVDQFALVPTILHVSTVGVNYHTIHSCNFCSKLSPTFVLGNQKVHEIKQVVLFRYKPVQAGLYTIPGKKDPQTRDLSPLSCHCLWCGIDFSHTGYSGFIW